MHFEVLLPALQVWPVDHHLTVEAARTQQRRVQDLRPVGRCQEDDAFLCIEAIHLGQELVQRLLSLIVATHHGTDTSRLPQSIQLVNEDDAWCSRLRLHEEVAHPCRPNTHKHLDKIRT